MIARRIFLAFTFAVTLIVSTAVARAQSGDPEQPASAARFPGRDPRCFRANKTGSGAAIGRLLGCHCHPGRSARRTATTILSRLRKLPRGGAFIGSDRTRPASKQHGVWAHLGGADFAYTFKEDLFDAMGSFAGILTVRVRLNLTGKDDFVGVANGEQRDANGNLIFNRCTTIRGARIKIEPLAPQCQSITPPQ